jgi:holliday junction DNA helicase RuvA
VFDFIKGMVHYVNPEYVVIENSGIGYQIFTPNPFIFKKNEETVVYTYQYVREDLIALYGFKTREERALFIKLLNVSGIGPKGGLAILASGQPGQVVDAIEKEDEKFLMKFPGVGKKTARQMILDLKGKLDDISEEFLPNLFTVDITERREKYSKAMDDAIEALKVLGYAEKEIKKIVPALSKEELTTDQYIKKALQMLLK